MTPGSQADETEERTGAIKLAERACRCERGDFRARRFYTDKLLYEAIEEIDESQVEAIRATGGSGWQVVDYGIVPQVLPAFAGITVFRWDINIRESTILGLVGAGGIGLQLQSSLNVLAWSQVTVIFALILGTVVLSEWVSSKVRQAII